MKFLCDVHISYKTVQHLNSLGFKTVHVNEILKKWHSTDSEICAFADKNNFIIVTKDSDFRNSFYIKKTPKKLIKINLGNCSNAELNKILSDIIEEIKKLSVYNYFIVEIDKNNILYNLLT